MPKTDGCDVEPASYVSAPRYTSTGALSTTELYDLVTDPEQWTNVAADPAHTDTVSELGRRLAHFFEHNIDPRYDLWNGGTGQAMVSRYLLFKERWGDEWEPTMTVGPRFPD